jgi:hypothetical protein
VSLGYVQAKRAPERKEEDQANLGETISTCAGDDAGRTLGIRRHC